MLKQLFDRGFAAGEICKQIKCLGIKKIFIYRTINWLLVTNSCKDGAWPACPHLARTKEYIKRICEKMCRNP